MELVNPRFHEGRLGRATDYSLDFNADEAIWGWAREEATGNLCLGSKAAAQERVDNLLSGLVSRKDEVKRRCRTVLQSRAEGLAPASLNDPGHTSTAHPTLALELVSEVQAYNAIRLMGAIDDRMVLYISDVPQIKAVLITIFVLTNTSETSSLV